MLLCREGEKNSVVQVNFNSEGKRQLNSSKMHAGNNEKACQVSSTQVSCLHFIGFRQNVQPLIVPIPSPPESSLPSRSPLLSLSWPSCKVSPSLLRPE